MQDFNKQELINQLITYLSGNISQFNAEKHLDTSFSRLGLDSAGHVQLSTIVEDLTQLEVEPTLAFDYPTINALANHLELKFTSTSMA